MLAVAVVLSVGSGAPASADVVTFDLKCGYCEGIDADTDGHVYISDPSRGRIYKVGQDGAILASFQTAPGYLLTSPRGVVVLADGNVAVSDSNLVIVLSPGGDLVTSFAGAFGVDLAVDDAGGFWFAEGAFLTRVTATGVRSSYSGDWPMNAHVGFSSVDDLLYVADSSRDRILVATMTGQHLRSITQATTPALAGPSDVAVDEAGNLFVALPSGAGGFGQILKLTPAGSVIGALRIFFPLTLAYRNGFVYATDQVGFHRIDTRTPVARLRPRAATARTSQTVTFDAGESYLPFGSIGRYEWDLDDDGHFETDTGTAAIASRLFTDPGTHSVAVRVTGSTGVTSTAATTLVVDRSAAVLRPGHPFIAYTDEPVRLDASGSALPDSSITGVRWDLNGDGSFETDTGTDLVTHRTFATVGDNAVSVRVTRSGGVVDVATSVLAIRLRPPPGVPGVTINSGAKYTNDPNVRVSLVWPLFTASVTLSNDGGFKGDRTRPVAPEVPWRLLRTGRERLPKTIYVRFDRDATSTFQDDIILDETPPKLRTASLAPRARPLKGRPASVLTVDATDNASRVKFIQVRINRMRRATTAPYRPTLTLKGRPRRVTVRVRDGAGNPSRWRMLKLAKLMRERRRQARAKP